MSEMVSKETKELHERAVALAEEIKAYRERDRQRSREIRRGLRRIRQLARYG